MSLPRPGEREYAIHRNSGSPSVYVEIGAPGPARHSLKDIGFGDRSSVGTMLVSSPQDHASNFPRGQRSAPTSRHHSNSAKSHTSNPPRSTSQPRISTPAPTTNQLCSLRRKGHRLKKLTDNALLKRYELEHQQQTLDSCYDFLEQSVDDFIRVLQSIPPEVPVETQRLRIQQDFEAARAQRAVVKSVRQSVSQLDSSLLKTAQKLTLFLDTGTGPTLPEDPFQPFTETESFLTKSSVYSDTPPLLAKFYDRKGDIGIFRERLQQLEDSYREELAQRELVADRGDEVAVSDRQCYNDFAVQRQAILEDLEKAEFDADDLAQQCEAAGLEIIENMQDSSSEAVSSTSNSPAAQIPPGISLSQPSPHATPVPLNRPFLSTRGQRRVRGWLDTLSHSHPSTPVIETEVRTLLPTQSAEDVPPFPFSSSSRYLHAHRTAKLQEPVIQNRKTFNTVSNVQLPVTGRNQISRRRNSEPISFANLNLGPFENPQSRASLQGTRNKSYFHSDLNSWKRFGGAEQDLPERGEPVRDKNHTAPFSWLSRLFGRE